MLFLSAHSANSHGLMNFPNPRGGLALSKFILKSADESGPLDRKLHFPAGSKDEIPGSGKRSQVLTAGRNGWTPFEPLKPSFQWRADVCGDPFRRTSTKFAGDHLRGGRFYHNAKIVLNVTQGGVIDVGLSITAHHNGFIELHVCDVVKCEGEISVDCFKKGFCYALERERVQKCESGNSRRCGPIDKAYPGRWYFPCSTIAPENRAGWETYGGDGTIVYKLPKNLVCEHCVLQWFWSAANGCNPPGVIEYFDGANKPNWGNCPGQGGAIGGVARGQKGCGGTRFAEEYLSCSDIRIHRKGGGVVVNDAEPNAKGYPQTGQKGVSDWTSVFPDYDWTGPSAQTGGAVQDIVLTTGGRRVVSLHGKRMVAVDARAQINIEAVTATWTRQAVFYIDGELYSIRKRKPFLMFRSDGVGMDNVPRAMLEGGAKVVVVADGDRDTAMVQFSIE